MLNDLDSHTGSISSVKILQRLHFIETARIYHAVISSTQESIVKLRVTRCLLLFAAMPTIMARRSLLSLATDNQNSG
ncbi:hypothetical protein COMA2_20148 [Candidatus Nitrospira nitrificans]|jgi:hypothetical protein|uniref:Uncharacterized protein n=1 Tax=Candidatus Nitrospira nitrificans TaxID=1742973 RepID=A0A0S4LDB5_9BACT|nr:hypothetical protein COMA2_20148 [Candidatus Nitrospira nitrificans]